MHFQTKENDEKISKPILSYRSQLPADRQMQYGFCDFLRGYGASFYTMRDRIIYGTSPIDEWELRGVERMIREFDPGYKGLLLDFYDQLSRDERGRFVGYMVEQGGMSRRSCYDRFRTFNFATWEVFGLLRCEELYLHPEKHFTEPQEIRKYYHSQIARKLIP